MNDDRNAASGSSARMPSMIVEEAVAAPPALHAPQQARRRVLQREVEVRDDRRQLEHRRDERVVHLGRVEVEQPHAREPVRAQRVEPAQQRRERARLADVAAVPREVLGDEHDLGDALLDERAHLGLDRLGRARALLAAERRDGAERARAVAALGDLHVRPRRARRRPRQLEQVAHAGRLAAAQHDVDERALVREADDRVGLGQRGRELVAVALGHAAGDDQPGAGLARVGRARARRRSTPGARPR